MPAETVVFDLGGALADWDPRHLCRKLFDDQAEMEKFLATLCNRAWIERQDEGRPVAESVAELAACHSGQAHPIEASWARWPEMIAGAVERHGRDPGRAHARRAASLCAQQRVRRDLAPR